MGADPSDGGGRGRSAGVRDAWSAPRARPLRWLAGPLGPMLAVVFPRGCAGCGAPDQTLCAMCRDAFAVGVERRMSEGVCLSGRAWCAAWYRGRARRAVLRWKDHHDEEVGRDLGGILACLAVGVAARETVWRRGFVAGEAGTVSVVPVPSSRASLRRRGRWQTVELAAAVADGLRRAGMPACVVPMLAMGRAGKSVAGHARDRAARLHGRLRVLAPPKRGTSKWDASQRIAPTLSPSSAVGERLDRFAAHAAAEAAEPRSIAPRPVVLVDDIVTTGATLSACSRALAGHGYRVIGAFALACAPDPGQRDLDR